MTFDLKLLDQRWLGDVPEEDTTSRGRIALVIGGREISGCSFDPDCDYGINQSAVALLQTVFVDHERSDLGSMDRGPLFFHGCCVLSTCPNCVIDFRVRHQGTAVHLDQFCVSVARDKSSKLPTELVQFIASAAVQVPAHHYAEQIVRFAEEAIAFLTPQRGSDYEAAFYAALYQEHAALLAHAREYLSTGVKTAAMIARARSFRVGGCERVEAPPA